MMVHLAMKQPINGVSSQVEEQD